MKEDFVVALDGTLRDLSLQVLDARLAGVLHAANAAKSKYGRELVDAGIGVNSSPFFAPSSSWKPLGDAWLRRKRATSSSPRYYEGLTGQLRDDILSMPTERIFGKTQLMAAAKVRKDDRGFFNPKIRRNIDTVWRDERGRFASAKMSGVKRFTVRVEAFPELGDNTLHSEYIDKLPISATSKMKLQTNKQARPLLVGFTEWFAKNRIEFAIEQSLKEVFK